MATRIRVLLVDDSELYTEALRDLLEEDRRFDVVGVARDGQQAVEMSWSLRPKVITMDVTMPGMDGLAAVSAIMSKTPTPILVLTGDGSTDLGPVAFEALRRGALDVQSKPVLVGADRGFRRLMDQLVLLASIPTVHHPNMVSRVVPQTAFVGGEPSRAVVGIVASTGGPSALASILHELPASFPAAILVVQHLADGFAPSFARWLRGTTALAVDVADEGALLESGRVLVAPDDAHLLVGSGLRVRLDRESPPREGNRPSGTMLLRSMARRLGPSGVGVILTGMGMDGASGLAELSIAAGGAIVQDAASSIIDGMPRAARDAVPEARVLPLSKIAEAIRGTVADIRDRSAKQRLRHSERSG